jgi:trans-aconitate 2-methyltransferase
MAKTEPNQTDAWNPVQYEKFKALRSKPFFDLLAQVKHRPAMRIIDLGCGTGELTTELHRHFKAASTIGMDSSGEMLSKANAFASGEPGLTFQKGDIEAWNLTGDLNGQFDLIFSNAALQWCENHGSLLKRMKSALRPSGQLALQMPMNQDYPTHQLAREMGAEISPKIEIQESMLSLAEYAELLYRLGFKNVDCFVRVYGHELESREGVIEWVKGTTLNSFKEKLSAADYAMFVDRYRERLFKQLPDNSPFFYPFKRLFLSASCEPPSA